MGHRWRDTDRSPTATASPTCTTNCSATSATCRRPSPFSTRWSRHGPHGSSSWRWEPAGWRSPSPALGHDVTGIDVSAAMLARLRSADGGQRVAAVHGDMVDDLPAGPFDVVFVAFNSLFMLTDPERQQACFAAVASVPGAWRCLRRRGVRAVGPAARRIPRRGPLDDDRPGRARRQPHRSRDADGHADSSSSSPTASRCAYDRTCCATRTRASSTSGRRPPGCASPSATPTSSVPRSPTTRRSTSACTASRDTRACPHCGI